MIKKQICYVYDLNGRKTILTKEKTKRRPKIAPTIAVWLSIASKLPENSPNSFVDLQSQLDCERNRPKNSSLRLRGYVLIKNLTILVLPPIAALI